MEKLPKNIYTKFFNDTSLADFTLISSDEKPFTVHRAFLADASEFFFKMFTTDMQEKKDGSAKFEDVDSTVLQEVLNYVYNGKAQIGNVQDASDIMYAAEKFGLQGLKEICSDVLKEKLCHNNVIGILITADMFRLKELEDLCLEIIVELVF